MNVTQALSTSGAADASTAAGSTRLPTQTLNQQDFLKLLVAQLGAQDPLNPQTDTEFVSQMAQFSSLQQNTAMHDELTQLTSDQAVAQASSMLGRTVTVGTATGPAVTGTVSAVQLVEGAPLLVVNGQLYDLSQVKSVALSQPYDLSQVKSLALSQP